MARYTQASTLTHKLSTKRAGQTTTKTSRTARPQRILAVYLACCFISACNSNTPPSPTGPPPQTQPTPANDIAAWLDTDTQTTPPDPPAPAGDLLKEVESFTSLESCIAERRNIDPVIGDAIDTLGYDTFLRDACRVLEASKYRNASLCEPILSTSLRFHCLTTVAVTTTDFLACPIRGTNHDPMCVALARGDDRLCESTPAAERTTCRAVLAHDTKLCGSDNRCRRKAERLNSLIGPKVDRPGLGTRASITVDDVADGETLSSRTYDITQAIIGATLRISHDGRHIELGNSPSVSFPSLNGIAAFHLVFRIQDGSNTIRQGRHTVPVGTISFELRLPHGSIVSTETATPPMIIDVDMIGLDLGDPFRFALVCTVGPKHNSQHVRLVVNTYVRDVVSNVGNTEPTTVP